MMLLIQNIEIAMVFVILICFALTVQYLQNNAGKKHMETKAFKHY